MNIKVLDIFNASFGFHITFKFHCQFPRYVIFYNIIYHTAIYYFGWMFTRVFSDCT